MPDLDWSKCFYSSKLHQSTKIWDIESSCLQPLYHRLHGHRKLVLDLYYLKCGWVTFFFVSGSALADTLQGTDRGLQWLGRRCYVNLRAKRSEMQSQLSLQLSNLNTTVNVMEMICLQWRVPFLTCWWWPFVGKNRNDTSLFQSNAYHIDDISFVHAPSFHCDLKVLFCRADSRHCTRSP